jgi:serine/threonine protein kinase
MSQQNVFDPALFDADDKEALASILPTTSFGDVVLKEVIGRGSSSTIYKATVRALPRLLSALSVVHSESVLFGAYGCTGRLTTQNRVFWTGQYGGRDVALKQLKLRDDSDQLVKEFTAEVKIMSRLRHANVIPFLGFTTTPQCLIIQELAHNGDLRAYLQTFAQALEEPPPTQQLAMAVDIARGMEYLHTFPGSPVLHRDLKTPNLLLDRDFRVKITDFGIAREKELRLGQTGIMTVCGTPIWTAPEILRGDTYNEKAGVFTHFSATRSDTYFALPDVFSFSICIWEVWQ